ncbi:MAG: MerR family transcriptional regulator [Anaerolineales bacterium]|nr:MerR family transcriptional regulator [Anaerolineales bacterium]MCB0012355.1 MerR family transcriptional regulator [Anaerolineales bacterium]MCB0020033.1 MerR family transcriptional regulator [Anaerolineales bacterium]
MKQEIPTYNMKVVVQETGLKPDTLRAWERRYGVPNPQRTAGGHRLYSQVEIDMLKWLVARQGEGMSISHAVELWHQLSDEGVDPTEAYLGSTDSPEAVAPISGAQLGQKREAWINACLAFDEARAQRILAEAFATYPVETVCLELLFQAMYQIGEGWYQGDVTIQQEHFASSLALRQLEALLAAQGSNARGEKILVANPAGEQHTFSPLLLSLMMRRRGLDVVYLGANVPLLRMSELLDQVKPALVLVSAQTLRTAASLKQMAEYLTGEGYMTLYGGAIFNSVPEIRAAIPGYFLGEDLQAAPDAVQRFLQRPPVKMAQHSLPAAYEAALDEYRSCRADIDAWVLHQLDGSPWGSIHLAQANIDMGDNIEAALQLGNMAFLSESISWVRGLLVNYHFRMPEVLLRAYMETYQQGCQRIMGRNDGLILDWFVELLRSPEFALIERGDSMLPA